MEPELQKSDYADAGSVSAEKGGSLAPASGSGEEASNAEFQQILDQVSDFLAKLPEYIGKFYGEYRQPVVTVALIVFALISVKILLALLSAINEIPLLSPTFELIGATYTGWFIYRYLLRAENRQELSSKVSTLKDQVLGQK